MVKNYSLFSIDLHNKNMERVIRIIEFKESDYKLKELS